MNLFYSPSEVELYDFNSFKFIEVYRGMGGGRKVQEGGDMCT